MSQKSQDAIDVLSEVIVDTIDKKLGTAKFDKSQTGVVTAVNGNTYTIAVFGSQYNITSDQIFTVGQSVVVTALQGDMKRLVCSPDNVGTMKTVDSKVKVVGDQLSSFIDTDFADTIIRYTDVSKFLNLKNQIDGQLSLWFYSCAPSSYTAPTKDWTTEDAKRLHVGDIYYDTKDGKAYSWLDDYTWNEIDDKNMLKILRAASLESDTLDGSRRAFFATPSPPYNRGDVWANIAEGGDDKILVCKTARITTDSFTRTDWVVASKYTDDTKANEALDSANKANTNLAAFKTEYDSDLKVTKEQIEARVTATTYSEDMSGLKERVSTAESKITQTEKDITLRATKEEAQGYAATAESNANKKLESYIKVTNDKIESKVSKTDFNGETVSSLINQDANSVKIKADKIELTGAVTIQNGKTVIDSDTINNSITQIDGSKITTGTIDAERLNLSGGLTIGTGGSITIGDNTISADKFAAGSIFKELWRYDAEEKYETGTFTFDNSKTQYNELLFFFRGLFKNGKVDDSKEGTVTHTERVQTGNTDSDGNPEYEDKTIVDSKIRIETYYTSTNTMVVPLIVNTTVWYHTFFNAPASYFSKQWEYLKTNTPQDIIQETYKECMSLNTDPVNNMDYEYFESNITRFFSVSVSSNNIVTVEFKNAFSFKLSTIILSTSGKAYQQPKYAIPRIIYGIK